MLSPFALLQDYAQRSATHLANTPQQSHAFQRWRGIGFMLAGQPLVVDLNQVQEVFPSLQCTKVPGVQPYVLGVANVRGRLTPMIDLAHALNLRPALFDSNQRVLIVSHQEQHLGLVVDGLLGMQHFLPDQQRSQHLNLAPALQPFCPHSYEKDSHFWPILLLPALLNAPPFLNFAL